MKKIYKILIILGILSATVSVSSCDMTRYDPTTIPTKITVMSDVEGFTTLQYFYAKGIFLSEYNLYGDYMSDLFQPSNNYGNFYGDLVRWNLTVASGEPETYWGSMYNYINQVNFLIQGINEFETDPLTDAEIDRLNLHLGEAHFFRALYYYELIRRFSPKWDATTVDNDHTGVLLVTEPFHAAKDFLPRASLQDIIDLIMGDLVIAENNLTDQNVRNTPNSYYVTPDVVKAFRARVALDMGDYTTAYNNATSVIQSGTYALTIDRDAFKGMWAMDDSVDGKTAAFDGVVYTKKQQELIMVLNVVDQNDSAGTPGRYFQSYIEAAGYNPQFFPSKLAIDAFDHENDIRFDAYFTEINYNLSGFGSDNIYFFTKYPGNPAVHQPNPPYSIYRHKGKPFRLAELYLIAAEAAYKSNRPGEANNYLNELRANRIVGWGTQTYTGEELFNQIKLERYKELYGEGFRYFDLKRWGDSMYRGDGIQSAILVNDDADLSHLRINAGDYRFVWPIPESEMEVNPQLAGQQNPVY